MSWIYSQSTGQLRTPKGDLFRAVGFAGQGIGLNESMEQSLKNVGPLPKGRYEMTNYFALHPHVGTAAIELTPDPTNEMFGRSGFFIHGLAIRDPLHSSEGCIVIGTSMDRLSIWADPDHKLIVNE